MSSCHKSSTSVEPFSKKKHEKKKVVAGISANFLTTAAAAAATACLPSGSLKAFELD